MHENDVLEQLARLVRLSKTQRKLLGLMQGMEERVNATQLVQGCSLAPQSTLWHALRELRKKGLAEFGEEKPVRLTSLGVLVAKGNREEQGTGEEKEASLLPASRLSLVSSVSGKTMGRLPRLAPGGRGC